MTDPFALNLRHLRALGHLVAAGSVNRAADSAGMSQPAMTQGLGKLERQLETLLFDRHAGGVSPTPAGLALTERSERAFSHLGAAARRAGRRGTGSFANPERFLTATQLEAFLYFADAQGFAGAASASGLSQPAIHRAVREIEQIVGAPLAERRGRGMALTAAGRTMARGIRLAAGEIAAGISEARDDGADIGRIAIGAMPLCRALLLPRALALFLEGRPRTIIDVVEGSWRELVDPLLDGVVDIMVGALREAPPAGIIQLPLFTDRLAIFGGSHHPLAGRDVDLRTLSGEPWIVGPAGTPLRAHWEALFEGMPRPAVPVECGSVMVIRGLLAQSNLLTLLSPDQVALETQSGMLSQVGPPLPASFRTIGISMRAGWRPTGPQKRLLDLLEQAALDTRLQDNQ